VGQRKLGLRSILVRGISIRVFAEQRDFVWDSNWRSKNQSQEMGAPYGAPILVQPD